MRKMVGSNPRGGRNFSHGKLSKINPLVLKSNYQTKKIIKRPHNDQSEKSNLEALIIEKNIQLINHIKAPRYIFCGI